MNPCAKDSIVENGRLEWDNLPFPHEEQNPYARDGIVKNGRLELDNLPFPHDTEVRVRVLIIPKVDLAELPFDRIRRMTKGIKGNIADLVNKERDER